MLVGLTYDLRSDYLKMGFSEQETAEFDFDETVEAIESTLNELGFETERIGHLRNLISRLDADERWDMVFNICEGMYGTGREAAVPALLDNYKIPYVFSGPVTLSLTLHKALTKRVVRDAGILTPDFFVVTNEKEIASLPLIFPVFAKPLAEGTGKGINANSVIDTREELRIICKNLIKTFRQPVLVETFLPGREFTVGITGTGKKASVVGVMEVFLKSNADENVYSYNNKEECEDRVIYEKAKGYIATEVARISLQAYRVLECADGGRVDIRMDALGRPNFIEINPLAGLHPQHSDLPILCKLHGISYHELMERIMRSALQRNGLQLPDKLILSKKLILS